MSSNTTTRGAGAFSLPAFFKACLGIVRKCHKTYTLQMGGLLDATLSVSFLWKSIFLEVGWNANTFCHILFWTTSFYHLLNEGIFIMTIFTLSSFFLDCRENRSIFFKWVFPQKLNKGIVVMRLRVVYNSFLPFWLESDHYIILPCPFNNTETFDKLSVCRLVIFLRQLGHIFVTAW